MGLTLTQQQAIAARGNVLLVAGAGTGKTRTLVERCLNCLLEGAPPAALDQILMVTFTEAAAAEMRQRIRERLEAQLAAHPEELHWHEQLALFETAYIGTLHSFCLHLVKPHFYELELDPQVAVLAEEEARLLAEETLTAVLQGHYAEQTPRAQLVQQLIQTHGGGNDQPIRALVLRLHHYCQSLPNPSKWLSDQLALFNASEPDQWRAWLLEGFEDWRAQWLPVLPSLSPAAKALYCADQLRSLPARPTREVIANGLGQILAGAGVGAGKGNGPSGIFRRFIDDARFLLSVTQVGSGVDPLAEDWGWVRAQMAALLELAREFGERFAQNKRELGLLDFHDLEQCALRLLWDNEKDQPSEIALQWRHKLRFIFVDEYQDINAAQDRIIEALSGQGNRANRFLVGDVKQSIYRFRLANPAIFQGYARTWRSGSGQTLPLVENFRSLEGILNFVNSFFELIMRPDVGGVAYDEEAKLRPGTGQERSALTLPEGPRVELHLRVKAAEREQELDEETTEALSTVMELEERDKEARLVALQLTELQRQAHLIRDGERIRPVEWGDVAILLRSPANKAESYAKEFSRLNVPLLVQQSGFYESLEVSDLVSLLQLLDNPLQDLPTLAVLHSPLAGLSIRELALIRLAAKGNFWTALVHWANSKAKTKPDKNEDVMLRKVSVFLERFADWRRLSRQVSLSRCLEVVLAETHYDTWLLTQPRGDQRLANLRRFLGLAQQFDRFQRQGLFRFLCFVEAQKRAEAEPEVKPVKGENMVRLLSIHQSKGLEFPVVVVPDLGKPFNLSDLHADIILDERFGLCPQIKPPHTGKRYPSLSYWLARRRQRREMLGEEQRLLYVAMTRARDTLLLSATISKGKLKEIFESNGQCPDHALESARSASDWLAAWFALHAGAGKTGSVGAYPCHGETGLIHWFVHDETSLIHEPETSAVPAPTVTGSVQAARQLRERLSWEYPFPSATRTPAKASVTALRRRAALPAEDAAALVPARQGKPAGLWSAETAQPRRLVRTGGVATAADIGLAHHTFLQWVSLERSDTVNALQSEVQRLQEAQLLTAEEAALLDLDAIAAFWQSDLGRNIRNQAQHVRRELAFTARFSAAVLATITGEPQDRSLEEEFVIVQGVADLVVLLPQEIWLVDFKTDALKPNEFAGRVKVYEPQMKLYARALAEIYQRPANRAWLYFLPARRAASIALP